MRLFRAICVLFALCFLASLSARAQDDPNFEVGLKPFGAFEMGNIDNISLGNGSLMVNIPLISYPQRGGKLTFNLSLQFYSAGGYGDNMCYPPPINQCYITAGIGGGNPLDGALLPEIVSSNAIGLTETAAAGLVPANFAVTDAVGGTHMLGYTGTNLLESVDATGWHAFYGNNNTKITSVTRPDGTVYNFSSGSPMVQDVNGNQITYSATSGAYTDTMGRTIPVPPAETPGTYSTNPSDFTNCTGSQPVTAVVFWNPPGPNGGTYPLKFCYYGTSPTTPAVFLESIVLPNQTAWTLNYTWAATDIYPGLIGSNLTNPLLVPVLSQVGFPTGGTLAYYSGAGGGVCSNAHSYLAPIHVSDRTLNPNDGITPASTWAYAYTLANGSNPPFTVVSAPSSGSVPDDTVHTFGLGGCHLYETETQSYQGPYTSGTLLKTVNTTYSYTPDGYGYGNLVPSNVQTVWPNGQTKSVAYTYDSGFTFQDVACCGGSSIGGEGTVYTGTFGKQLTQKEYDYGGALLRTTNTNYLALTNSTYKGYNILDPVSSVQITDGGGTQRAYTTYSYDQYALSTSNITTQHGTPSNGTYRGNLTSTSRWLNTTGAYLTSTNTYFDTGMPNVAKDPNLNPTTYGYSATYVGAYPTTITNALNQATTNAYDFNMGLLTSTTDPNSQTTSYAYDNVLRTTSITYPDTGSTTFSYPTPNEVDISEKIDTRYRTSSLLVDGVGRNIRQIVSNGESPSYNQSDTTYDGNGRVSFKSYPYQGNGFSTARVTSGAGDSFVYDAFGRTTSVAHSDGSSVLSSYTGRATSVQDEGNGTQRVQRVSQVDGLGRLSSVCEVSANLTVGISGSQSAAPCGQDIAATGFLTTYAYDALDNLTAVAQGPLNGRSFVYDSLSRLTSGTNPEAGTMTYTYDADGNVLTKKDARNITITYGPYDGLNRLGGKTYSDATPAVTYHYDQTSAMGATLTNPIGRKTSESIAGANPTGSAFSYDPMGRVVGNWQCTPQNCSGIPFSLAYAYDLLGDVITSTNGEGVTLTGSYNLGARLISLTSSLSDANHPGTLFGYTNIAHYNAAGSLTSVTLGNDVSETRTYDGRLRLTGITDGSIYTLTIPTSGGYAPNGDILAANDNVNGNWTYAYDGFNRLISSNQNSGATTYSYAYDRFGNRWNQTVTHGSGTPSSLGFDANNHITASFGVTYDAAGDTTYDGTTTYTYDAEGRVITASNGVSGSSSYVYDAEGRRVRKTTAAGGSVDFLYDLGGHEIDQVSSAGSWTRGEVYAGGRHVVTYLSSPNEAFFIHSDWLGTERARSTPTGSSYETCTSLPFGDALNCTGSDVSPMHFTGKERDSESNLDNFGARYDASSMGRFMSPDPGNAGASDVAPQTWNAYSYVSNQPLNATDPDGLDCLYFMGSWISVVRGDCISDKDNGYYVDGTVDTGGTGKLSVSQWNKTDQTLDVPLANGQDAQIHFNPSLGPNDPPNSPDYLFDGLLFGALGGVPGLVRGGASLFGDLFGTGVRGVAETGAESLTNQAAGKIIGWGTDQSAAAVEKTARLAQTLTQDQVKEMVANGLTKEKVEQLAGQYAKALANETKAAANDQLAPRLQLMQKIIQLWPGK